MSAQCFLNIEFVYDLLKTTRSKILACNFRKILHLIYVLITTVSTDFQALTSDKWDDKSGQK